MTLSEIKAKLALLRECLEIVEASENRQDAAERLEWLIDVTAVQSRRLESALYAAAARSRNPLAEIANMSLTDSTNLHTE